MPTQLAEVEQAIVEATTSQPVANDDGRDWEAEARVRGWKPEEEFADGEHRPREFKSAEQFVRDGEERSEFQKDTIDQLKKQVAKLGGDLKRLTKAEQTAYQRGMDDLKAQMKEAVANGDTEAFERLDQQREKLIEERTAPQENPEEAFDAFREANDWYDLGGLASATAEQSRARIIADREFEKAVRAKMHETMTPTELFERVKEKVIAQIPDLGKAPAQQQRQKPASDVSGVSRPGGASAKSGASLPQEAKDHARRFFDMGVIKAKTLNEAYDKYAKQYFSE